MANTTFIKGLQEANSLALEDANYQLHKSLLGNFNAHEWG